MAIVCPEHRFLEDEIALLGGSRRYSFPQRSAETTVIGAATASTATAYVSSETADAPGAQCDCLPNAGSAKQNVIPRPVFGTPHNRPS